MSKRCMGVALVAVLSCLFLAGGLMANQDGSGESCAADELEIVRVIDGDSLKVFVNGRRDEARMVGIDAPELGQRPWGRRAKEHLEELLGKSGKLRVEYDVERRDKYGRLLAYVRTADGRLVNEEMLRDGFAVLFTVPPNVRYVVKFKKAQEEARQRGRGIWAGKGLQELPSDYRRDHPRKEKARSLLR